MKRISTRNIKLFRDLHLDRFANLALVRTAINGVETDAIAVVGQTDNEEFIICPMLIIVNSKIYANMTPPAQHMTRMCWLSDWALQNKSNAQKRANKEGASQQARSPMGIITRTEKTRAITTKKQKAKNNKE